MRIENMSFEYGDKLILKDVNLFISQGEKIGLVGSNGAGKTTFFKLLLEEIYPVKGDIVKRSNTHIGWLPQVIAEDYSEKEMTVKEYILSSRPIEVLQNQINKIYEEMCYEVEDEQEVLIKKAEKIQEQLEFYDCYEYESIMLNIAYNMKMDDDFLKKKLSELSGGQKSKVAFARLLYAKHDIMLLDEPTNHLDKETKKFVIEFLKKTKTTVLIISHDVEFLNEITTTTFFFDNRTHKVIRYNGNYSVFQKLHQEYEERMDDLARKQDAEISKLESVIESLQGVSSKRKKMAKDREKKLEKIMASRIERTPIKKRVKFSITKNREENAIPLSINKISFKYPNMSSQILNNLSFEIMKGERFLVVGTNGAGKSTLLKLIAKELIPGDGEIKIGTKVDLGYYAQEHEILDFERTILENFSVYNISEKKLRALLSHFLFFSEDIDKKIKILSPGERARVALAKVAISGSNVILLDEPTNHLDPETQSIIAEVFANFKGTIILVSHNPEFVESLGIERMLVLPEGKIEPYDSNFVKKIQKKNNNQLTSK